jgi:hypothetical protein
LHSAVVEIAAATARARHNDPELSPNVTTSRTKRAVVYEDATMECLRKSRLFSRWFKSLTLNDAVAIEDIQVGDRAFCMTKRPENVSLYSHAALFWLSASTYSYLFR